MNTVTARTVSFPAWHAHLLAARLAGSAGLTIGPDPLVNPFVARSIVPVALWPGGTVLRPLALGGAVAALPEHDLPPGAAAVIITAPGGTTGLQSVCDAAPDWVRASCVLLLPDDLGTAAVPAGWHPLEETHQRLAIREGDTDLIAKAQHVVAKLSDGTLDCLDLIRTHCKGNPVIRGAHLSKTGDVRLVLSPLSCLRGLSKARALDIAQQGCVALHRDRPLTLRLPVFSTPYAKAEITFSTDDLGKVTGVDIQGGILLENAAQAHGLRVLRLQAAARPGPWIDVTLSGHGLIVEDAVSILAQPTADALPPIDPLANYGDPLARYDQGGKT